MSGPGAKGADTRFGAAFFERAGLLRAALFFALPRGEDPRAALLRAGADVRDAMWRPYRPNPTSHGSHTRNTGKLPPAVDQNDCLPIGWSKNPDIHGGLDFCDHSH